MLCLNRTGILIVLFYLLSTIVPVAAQTDTVTTVSKRPSVGLVLSGGGAKGWAYIGVLRVLQEAGLELDYIAGASAGSIVGGMYALGYHPDTIEKIVRSQDWDAVMKDVLERKYIAYEDKVYGGRYIFSLPMREKKIGLKSSIYEGQNVDLLLNRYYSLAYKDSLFKDFQTPFVCIGTDLYEGKEVVLDRGYLPMAIRSSMAIPAYFSPVEYEGNYLVDGGVVNNYPVSPLKSLGVDIIVGADVQSRNKRTKEDLQNLTTILDQIIGYHRQEENQKGLEETDLYIHLKMPYNMMDFNNFDSIINFGEQVAREHFDEIKALADSLNAIEYRPLKEYTTVPLDSIEISQVKYAGYDRMRRKYLESFFGEFDNNKVAMSDIEEAINYAYGTGFFSTVFYQLEYKDGKTNLVIHIKESDPGKLSAGLHYDTDYQGSILANLTVRNKLGNRSKLFIDLVLGNYPLLRGSYIIENGVKPGIGLDFDLFSFEFDDYVKSENGNKFESENTYYFDNLSGSVFVPISIRNRYAFRAGFEYQYFRFRQKIAIDTSLVGYQTYSSFGNIYFSFAADTRDKYYFPTRGANVKFKGFYTLPFSQDWNQDLFDNSFTLFLNYDQYIRLSSRVSVKAGIFIGGAFNREGPITINTLIENDFITPVPVQNQFFVGGLNQYNYMETFIPFTGLRFVHSQGIYIGVGRLHLQYNFWKELYATGMFDIGQNSPVWDLFWEEDFFMAGAGLKLSYNSFIGPVEGSIMWSRIGSSSEIIGPTFFLSVGFWL